MAANAHVMPATVMAAPAPASLPPPPPPPAPPPASTRPLSPPQHELLLLPASAAAVASELDLALSSFRRRFVPQSQEAAVAPSAADALPLPLSPPPPPPPPLPPPGGEMAGGGGGELPSMSTPLHQLPVQQQLSHVSANRLDVSAASASGLTVPPLSPPPPPPPPPLPPLPPPSPPLAPPLPNDGDVSELVRELRMLSALDALLTAQQQMAAASGATAAHVSLPSAAAVAEGLRATQPASLVAALRDERDARRETVMSQLRRGREARLLTAADSLAHASKVRAGVTADVRASGTELQHGCTVLDEVEVALASGSTSHGSGGATHLWSLHTAEELVDVALHGSAAAAATARAARLSLAPVVAASTSSVREDGAQLLLSRRGSSTGHLPLRFSAGAAVPRTRCHVAACRRGDGVAQPLLPVLAPVDAVAPPPQQVPMPHAQAGPDVADVAEATLASLTASLALLREVAVPAPPATAPAPTLTLAPAPSSTTSTAVQTMAIEAQDQHLPPAGANASPASAASAVASEVESASSAVHHLLEHLRSASNATPTRTVPPARAPALPALPLELPPLTVSRPVVLPPLAGPALSSAWTAAAPVERSTWQQVPTAAPIVADDGDGSGDSLDALCRRHMELEQRAGSAAILGSGPGSWLGEHCDVGNCTGASVVPLDIADGAHETACAASDIVAAWPIDGAGTRSSASSSRAADEHVARVRQRALHALAEVRRVRMEAPAPATRPLAAPAPLLAATSPVRRASSSLGYGDDSGDDDTGQSALVDLSARGC